MFRHAHFILCCLFCTVSWIVCLCACSCSGPCCVRSHFSFAGHHCSVVALCTLCKPLPFARQMCFSLHFFLGCCWLSFSALCYPCVFVHDSPFEQIRLVQMKLQITLHILTASAAAALLIFVPTTYLFVFSHSPPFSFILLHVNTISERRSIIYFILCVVPFFSFALQIHARLYILKRA